MKSKNNKLNENSEQVEWAGCYGSALSCGVIWLGYYPEESLVSISWSFFSRLFRVPRGDSLAANILEAKC